MAIMNFNYGQAISQAHQIEAIAQDMMNVANRQLQTTHDSIEACWRGESSRQFIVHLTETQADVRAHARKLEDLARRIRTVARILEDAEQKAKEAQQRRDDSGSGRFSGGGGGGGGGSGW